MPEPTSDSSLLLPVVVEQVDLVRVEKSLHSLGFFASTANREISRTILQIFRRPDGQRIHAKAVIEGIPSLGLPTTADRDKYMAFMKIALDQREISGPAHQPHPLQRRRHDQAAALAQRRLPLRRDQRLVQAHGGHHHHVGILHFSGRPPAVRHRYLPRLRPRGAGGRRIERRHPLGVLPGLPFRNGS